MKTQDNVKQGVEAWHHLMYYRQLDRRFWSRRQPCMYDDPAQMEPMVPKTELTDLALALVSEAAALGSKLHPVARSGLTKLLRNMNSYYSNLIEGHRTHPLDIERALKKEFSRDSKQRALQLESAAHIEVEEQIDARLAADSNLNPCTPDFLGWIHAEFYKRMPAEFQTVRDPSGEALQVRPGALREVEVEVGRHVPPTYKALPRFLDRFAAAYDPSRLSQLDRIVASASSHHRLAWIHPFLDGNGRVARLFTHAYMKQTRIDGQGLWSIARGLARKRGDYMAALAFADMPRMGDLDGRGNLTEKGLSEFCRYFLGTALDQIQFMRGLLDMDQLQDNIDRYVQRNGLKEGSGKLLGDLARRGEIARGEVGKYFNLGASQARLYLKQLLEAGLVVSESEKGAIRMDFPMHAVPYYFPKLYPAEVEIDLEQSK